MPLHPRLRPAALAAAALALLAPCAAALAADYNENEPNNNFPPSFLPGNPTFQSGDRLLGSYTIGSDIDFDEHYLTFAGPSAPGLYRYTFDLAITAGDSFLELYDATPDGFILGRSDDFPGLGFASRVIFDQFHTSTAATVFGTGIRGFGATAFDYALTVTRTETPVNALGALAAGTTIQTNTTPPGGATWYSFTLAGASTLTLDTFGSLNDDTEIALFDGAGNTLAANDDASPGNPLSELTVALTGGTYFVAVGPFDSLYNWNLNTNEIAGWDRDGFGGGGDAFESNNNLQSHTLNLRVAAAVPEPGTLGLLAGAGVGVAALRVRRRRQAG